jgi:toxin ParE1/3/4
MAQIIWTNPALARLDAIGDYIALDNLKAAEQVIKRVFEAADQPEHFPKSGPHIPEFPKSVYRHLVFKPCRIIYRLDGEEVVIVLVIRTAMVLRREYLQ